MPLLLYIPLCHVESLDSNSNTVDLDADSDSVLLSRPHFLFPPSNLKRAILSIFSCHTVCLLMPYYLLMPNYLLMPYSLSSHAILFIFSYHTVYLLMPYSLSSHAIQSIFSCHSVYLRMQGEDPEDAAHGTITERLTCKKGGPSS